MSNQTPEIFISYAWGNEGEEIVNSLYEAFKSKSYNIIRDKIDLEYKGSISEFMNRIGKGKIVIVVISDKYLRSHNCMYEILEIEKNKDFLKRTFPIVLNDAHIYDPLKQLEYAAYWDEKIKDLNDKIKASTNIAYITPILKSLDLYTDIRRLISKFIAFISDLNTCTPEIHKKDNFKILISAINKQIFKDEGNSPIETQHPNSTSKVKKYNIPKIIALLSNSFNDTELQQFCMMYYNEVYNSFSNGMDKTQKILKLIDYVNRRLLMDSLLDNLENTNQSQFDLNKPYYSVP